MKALSVKDWLPVGGLSLEEDAHLVATASTGNYLVVAGPGAGKTELLAQRACFLLQTNTCKFPRRILAISFKRDAAFTLKERVTRRAGLDLANRFDSFTYDSFAKQLLDRFRSALPQDYAIPKQYDVLLSDDFLMDIYTHEDPHFVNTNSKGAILAAFVGNALPYPKTTKVNALHSLVWTRAITQGKLTFRMIMRLAQYIISTNPTIRDYLQKTYDYVFLDEFQDTTTIQYEFIKSCFAGGHQVLTAVGDDKQRIMTFAGARKSIFEDFVQDTAARRIPLTMNFRSAPLLVNVQNSLIKTLLGKKEFATPSPKWKGDEGECMIWEFENQQDEAAQLVTAVSDWLKQDQLNERDICILVKGSLDKYVGHIVEHFRKAGIKARDESKFQEFLSDEVVLFLIHSFYMMLEVPTIDSKSIVFSFLSRTHNEISDAQLLKLDNNLLRFMKQQRGKYAKNVINQTLLDEMVSTLIDYAKVDRICAVFPQYRQVTYLHQVLTEFKKTLGGYLNGTTGFKGILDQFCGVDTIPVMTVHKSKGLEYHTVLFVGLEDGAFWSFSKQPDEDKSTFFVALSRAKMRVAFTFSQAREGFRERLQSRQQIRVIFDELAKAGVTISSYLKTPKKT